MRANKKPGQWLRNRDLADLLNVTPVTIWRWQRNASMKFPQPSIVNGLPFTDVDEINAWMKSRVVNFATSKAKKVA
ncbi:helix-turn-helix transcriptional regulator [Bradyrhizobium lupini]|uniref:helix-turn-helix transcriptional regulator n=1 Tax=Rhizobium lupini TaxID=136996 RepID=UPI0036729AEC